MCDECYSVHEWILIDSSMCVFYCFSEVPVDVDIHPIILTEIIYNCAHRMKQIGACLKIQPHKIEIIQASERNPNDQFLSMISSWSQKDHGTGPIDQPRTAQELYDAVKRVGCPDAADAFKGKVEEQWRQRKTDIN